jgi:hypothetical protein
MLRFSRHARERLLERNISESDVSLVLDDPDVTFPDKKGNPCTVKEIDGRRIKVVVSDADPEFVITVIDLDDV